MDYVNDTSVLDLTAEDVKDPLLVEQPVEDINQYKQFVARLLELQEKNLEIQNVHAEENLRMLEMIREKDTYILQYGIEIPQNRKCLSVFEIYEIPQSNLKGYCYEKYNGFLFVRCQKRNLTKQRPPKTYRLIFSTDSPNAICSALCLKDHIVEYTNKTKDIYIFNHNHLYTSMNKEALLKLVKKRNKY